MFTLFIVLLYYKQHAKNITFQEYCSKAVVGKLIGKNGANIKNLIKKTMAKI